MVEGGWWMVAATLAAASEPDVIVRTAPASLAALHIEAGAAAVVVRADGSLARTRGEVPRTLRTPPGAISRIRSPIPTPSSRASPDPIAIPSPNLASSPTASAPDPIRGMVARSAAEMP